MREIETKFRVSDMKALENKLLSLGCTMSDPITQEDINFIHKDDTQWFETSSGTWNYPRIRIQDGKPLRFTIKRPVTNEMDCIEHEIEINDAEQMRQIMHMFDYIEGVTVKKKRRSTTYREYSMTLDEVDLLGSFMEIERVVDDGNPEEIQKQMFTFAKEHLGLEHDGEAMKGYDIMMHHKQQENSI